MSKLQILKPEETEYQIKLRGIFGDWWYEKLGQYLNSDFKTKLLPSLKTLPPYFPETKNIFNVYKATPDPKVIIVGQSPYHTAYFDKPQATGFAFECANNPSVSMMRLIHPQMNSMDLIGFEPVNLQPWVKQGVMLLNRALTITKYNSKDFKSHNIYTDLIRNTLDSMINKPNMCFIFYGAEARAMITKEMRELHNSENIFIHESIHPAAIEYSNYTQDDFDNGFNATNNYLFSNNLNKIDWSIVY